MAPKRDAAGLIEGRGKWVLPIGAGRITQLRVDNAFTLLIESWIGIRIESPFSYGAAENGQRFDPSATSTLAPLLDLYRATVTSAEIRKDGRLTVAFADGTTLVVDPDEQYEAFTVAGTLQPIERGFNFVSLPGGGLARF